MPRGKTSARATKQHHQAEHVKEGTKTGRLLILKSGEVAIVKGGTELARVSEPGAVFGEMSLLLDQPHTADVRTLAPSEFHIADAGALQDPAALLYVTAVLAQRLDAANRGLLELKAELGVGGPSGLIDAALDKVDSLLNALGSGLLRAGAGYGGYPFM